MFNRSSTGFDMEVLEQHITRSLAVPVDQNDDDEELVTVDEVAKQLRVDDTTVRRWINQGVLEAVILPHRGTRKAYRIKRSVLRRQMPNSGF